MSFTGTRRPPPRWSHCSTELHDFTLVSYRVDTDRLRLQLPASFEPDVFVFDDGTAGSLVSAAAFSFRDFSFRALPVPRVSCGQVDYRTYGRLGGERGVWFFGTSVDTPLVVLPRLVWRMPWQRARIRLEADWDGAGERAVHLSATNGASAVCELRLTGAPTGRLDGFVDADDTIERLTHPTIGWFERSGRLRSDHGTVRSDHGTGRSDDGTGRSDHGTGRSDDGTGRSDHGTGRSARTPRISRYSVWHEPMRPERAEVVRARFSTFEDRGLTTPTSRPHSVLVQRRVHFDVHTPPSRVGG